MTENRSIVSGINEYLGIVLSVVTLLGIVVTMAISISGRATIKDLDLVKRELAQVRLNMKDKEDSKSADEREERLRSRIRKLENRCSRLDGGRK